jgi:ABC-type antimicrobial peptide transport system permease subunit
VLGKGGEGLRFRNLSRVRRAFEQISGILAALLASVSVVTLLVGGIGIMNIMLVAVSERTREIGLRKALGARFDDILSQFVVEAVMLSTVGGAAGAASGAAVARLIPGLQDSSGIVFAAGMAAFGAAVLTGVAFGLWPAWRAARRDPVESLRYE